MSDEVGPKCERCGADNATEWAEGFGSAAVCQKCAEDWKEEVQSLFRRWVKERRNCFHCGREVDGTTVKWSSIGRGCVDCWNEHRL